MQRPANGKFSRSFQGVDLGMSSLLTDFTTQVVANTSRKTAARTDILCVEAVILTNERLSIGSYHCNDSLFRTWTAHLHFHTKEDLVNPPSGADTYEEDGPVDHHHPSKEATAVSTCLRSSQTGTSMVFPVPGANVTCITGAGIVPGR